jgi:hypothetical protein
MATLYSLPLTGGTPMFGLSMPEFIVMLVLLPVIFLPTILAWRTQMRVPVLVVNLGALVVAAVPFGVFLSVTGWLGAMVVAVRERNKPTVSEPSA